MLNLIMLMVNQSLTQLVTGVTFVKFWGFKLFKITIKLCADFYRKYRIYVLQCLP